MISFPDIKYFWNLDIVVSYNWLRNKLFKNISLSREDIIQLLLSQDYIYGILQHKITEYKKLFER